MESDLGRAVGKRIRSIRRETKQTLEDVSAKLDISASALGHIETGRNLISLEHLIKLPAILGCRITDLLPDSIITDYDCQHAADPRLRAIIENWQELPEIVKAAWAFTVEQYREENHGQ